YSFNLSVHVGCISKAHLNFESIRSSGFASFHFVSVMYGARMDCTMNLCLLFSLGS
uniref:Uncharacterized protein n=1 Tax=Cynoglossus semilaevis TaxID=244447 RepID=A0A3P8WWA7_CYNSE